MSDNDIEATSDRRRKMQFLLEGGLILVSITLGVVGFLRVLPAMLKAPESVDFAPYYLAAASLNSGQPLYQMEAMASMAKRTGVMSEFEYLYPPFFAVLLRPLAQLPYHEAARVWALLNWLFLGISVLITIRLVRARNRWIMPALALSLLLPAVYDTILLGQINLLVTMLLCLAIGCPLCLSHGPPMRCWLGCLSVWRQRSRCIQS